MDGQRARPVIAEHDVQGAHDLQGARNVQRAGRNVEEVAHSVQRAERVE